ncbi:ribulose-phosphate 3-epimerase [Candidatus Legionella polyplacis]|uniref:Ribulose-phosphate 3-epimerase n=1 Tax=Candidatus Legionella polyplacis TaxID=2005262 RepID=A0ABZ2H0U7_9GAMM
MKKNYLIIPSILSANPICLKKEIKKIIETKTEMIHIDITDNHYVPNLTFGISTCQSIKKHFPTIKLDIHLMAHPTRNLIYSMLKIKANRITIHIDSSTHINHIMNIIKKHCKIGIALNPTNSPLQIKKYFNNIDYVVIMSVNPGFPNQKFIPKTKNKIKWIKKNFPKLTICIDGGINTHNILSLAKHGAKQFVIGNTIFSKSNYNKIISNLYKKLNTLNLSYSIKNIVK